MRSLFLIALGIALATLTGCAAQSAVAPPSDSSTPGGEPSTPTERTVLRPVTAAGRPAGGFSVAVDDDILACSPSSAYAVACWNGAAPATAICFRDPWSPDLVEMALSGSFPAAPAPATPQPLGLVLSDGDRCLIRSGGVWNDLAAHPGWYGTYSCAVNGAVWAAEGAGIDQSTPRWSVQVAPISGSGPLGTRDVVTAFFVGTRSG